MYHVSIDLCGIARFRKIKMKLDKNSITFKHEKGIVQNDSKDANFGEYSFYSECFQRWRTRRMVPTQNVSKNGKNGEFGQQGRIQILHVSKNGKHNAILRIFPKMANIGSNIKGTIFSEPNAYFDNQGLFSDDRGQNI